MEATININDGVLAETYKQGYDDCLKVVNNFAKVQASQTPYIKGYAGLQKYLGVGYTKVQDMLADGMPMHEKCGIAFFVKSEVDKYLKS